MKNTKLVRASATVSLGKDKDYTFESSLQSQTWKKKIIYKPTITIRTPTAELLAIGGGFTNIYGKKMALDFVMDKVFKKPLIFKGKPSALFIRTNIFNEKASVYSYLTRF